jgi:hypothetical protein
VVKPSAQGMPKDRQRHSRALGRLGFNLSRHHEPVEAQGRTECPPCLVRWPTFEPSETVLSRCASSNGQSLLLDDLEKVQRWSAWSSSMNLKGRSEPSAVPSVPRWL